MTEQNLTLELPLSHARKIAQLRWEVRQWERRREDIARREDRGELGTSDDWEGVARDAEEILSGLAGVVYTFHSRPEPDQPPTVEISWTTNVQQHHSITVPLDGTLTEDLEADGFSLDFGTHPHQDGQADHLFYYLASLENATTLSGVTIDTDGGRFVDSVEPWPSKDAGQ